MSSGVSVSRVALGGRWLTQGVGPAGARMEHSCVLLVCDVGAAPATPRHTTPSARCLGSGAPLLPARRAFSHKGHRNAVSRLGDVGARVRVVAITDKQQARLSPGELVAARRARLAHNHHWCAPGRASGAVQKSISSGAQTKRTPAAQQGVQPTGLSGRFSALSSRERLPACQPFPPAGG
jgi:hypothetical protein